MVDRRLIEDFLPIKDISARETSLSEKYLVVTYKEVNKNDGFVVTAYFTNKLSEEREILWKQ